MNRHSTITCKGLIFAATALWIASASPAWSATAPNANSADADVTDSAGSGSAVALKQRYEALRPQLANSVFKRPLVIESQESSNDVKGEIYAQIKQPFATVNAALGTSQAWCDVLILHLNTKYCRIKGGQDSAAGGTTLLMNVGKKFDQPLEDSYQLAFVWRATQRKADFLQVIMSAEAGPLGTRNYQIVLEAVPIDANTTFLHLSYAYGFGATGKWAMQAYLGTIGRNKVGFTTSGQQPDNQPVYVDGMRGLVERNTMRYYLAIEAYLGALKLPAQAQFEKRIADWFIAVERYPRQLHEMEQREYLDMKRMEYRRQQAPL